MWQCDVIKCTLEINYVVDQIIYSLFIVCLFILFSLHLLYSMSINSSATPVWICLLKGDGNTAVFEIYWWLVKVL